MINPLLRDHKKSYPTTDVDNPWARDASFFSAPALATPIFYTSLLAKKIFSSFTEYK